ncbi:unnamed protein product [Schistocephalus solidus]|uniref:Lectin_legB domain-containing protein n=1 Tax=Schistocephalus solidus TaxID=70667 RepID=A0A183TE64_SCHSO|nr:unnamed protein product [Schistocephalus solidus]
MRDSGVVCATAPGMSDSRTSYHLLPSQKSYGKRDSNPIYNHTAKTVVIYQPPPGMEYNAPRINFKGAQLKNVESFAYLGSASLWNMRIDDEVAHWISKANVTFNLLLASMWNRQAPITAMNSTCPTPNTSVATSDYLPPPKPPPPPVPAIGTQY